MATTYIQFTGRLKATSQEGILAEAQQVAVSSTDNTNIKTYIDNQINAVKSNISSVAGSVYRPKGSLTVANFKALTSAAVGDVYNITEQFTLSGRTYPAYTNVACVKAFSAAVTPDDSYWDALGGTVDLSPYAKTTYVNSKVDTLTKSISDNVSALETKISTAQSTANTANSTASANKTSISGLTTRVSTLEGSDHVNKINSVKVNGTALTVDSSDKSVNIDLSGKVDKVSGKGLSTNDFTADYKSKLDGIASGANKYTLPAATKDALGGVKVHAVDDGTMSSYQGAFTTMRNGQIMCDLVTDSQNGALSKTDYAAFKKTGTDLAALDTRVTSAEGDINQLFLDKADASDVNIVEGRVDNIYDRIGTDVSIYNDDVYCTIKIGTFSVSKVGFGAVIGATADIASCAQVSIPGNVTIGTHGCTIGTDGPVSVGSRVYIDSDVKIGGSVYIEDIVKINSNVAIGYDTGIGSDVSICDDIFIGESANIGENVVVGGYANIGTNAIIGNEVNIGKGVLIGTNGDVKISGNTSLACINGILHYGNAKGATNIAVANKSDLDSLTTRVTAIENLLKLA